MFQFPGFASRTYVFSSQYTLRCGFPHSEISGSKPTRSSPELIAACYVLHRLSVPRHPPNALVILDPYQKSDVLQTRTNRVSSKTGLTYWLALIFGISVGFLGEIREPPAHF